MNWIKSLHQKLYIIRIFIQMIIMKKILLIFKYKFIIKHVKKRIQGFYDKFENLRTNYIKMKRYRLLFNI